MKVLSLATLAAGAILAAAATPAERPVINDAEIAHIAVTAGNIDITAGHLALAFSADPEIRSFAERMITDHSAVNEQAVALVTKLGVTPQDNEVSQQLAANAKAKMDELSKLRGLAFDKAYIANEAAYHEAVAQAVTGTLIPSARNAELKGLLESVVPAFSAHLDHAQKLAAEFSRK